MENFSQNKKISLGLGVVLIISLFLPWLKWIVFSVSLIGIPGVIADLTPFLPSLFDSEWWDFSFKNQLVVYIGYVYLVLGTAGLYFNYKGEILKSKLAYYSMIAYFILVLVLNISEISDATNGMGESYDGPNIFSLLGIGLYIFITSFIGNLMYLKEESESEVIEGTKSSLIPEEYSNE